MEHSCFAMELKYSLDHLMDCVCIHNFMGDKHIFSVISSLKELPTLYLEKKMQVANINILQHKEGENIFLST